MSIPDKITSISNHIEDAYDKLNDLGVDLTNIDKNLDNIAELIDGVYEDYPKTPTMTGTDIVLNNTKEARLNSELKGNTSQDTSILPEGYTEVDYIESSGTQYVNTGFKPTSNTKYELDIDSINSNDTAYIIGTIDGNSNRNNIYLTSNGYFSAGYGSAYQSTTIKFQANTKYNIKLDKNLFYIDNVLAYSFTEETFNNTVTSYLFARNNGGTIDRLTSMKLYSCKIYDNNIIVRNFIPCYRNSDNEIGLYDLVNNVFYTNAGTGTFTYGSTVTRPSPDYSMPIHVIKGNNTIKVSNLPDGYTEVEYIESTGTQYIDTGRYPSDIEDIECKIEISSTGAIYGAWKGTNTSRRHLYRTSTAINIGYGTTGNATITSDFTGVLNIKAHFENKNQRLIINDLGNVSFTDSPTNPKLNAYLFGRNYSGGDSDKVSMKLYYWKIYDNGTLVRDYIPCIKNSNNEVGLYDLVNNTFYTNAGTGEFIAGNTIERNYDINLKSKNLLDENLLEPGSIYEGNGNNNNDSGVLNTRVRTKDFIPAKSNTSYILSCIVQTSIWLILYFYDEDKTFINSKSMSTSTGILIRTTPSNCKYIRAVIATKTATDIQLKESTYEGNNLFDKNNANILNAYILNNSMVSSTGNKTLYISCKPNTTYKITKMISNTNRLRVGISSTQPTVSSSLIKSIQDDNGSESIITTTEDTNYLCVYFYNSNSTTPYQDVLDSIIIIEYDNTYEPYFDYELCKIDDYEDYFYKSANKWYLHNEIGYWHLKDYTFTYISVAQGSLFRKSSLSKAKKEALLVYSPIYKGITTSETRYNNTIAYNPSSTQSLDIIDNRYTASNDFNAYIQTLDDVNDKVYCVLRTITNTEITSPTLISQLEAFYNAKSMDDKTYITQTNEDLPFIITAETLMKEVI